MADVNSMSMSELIAHYNGLATAQQKPVVDSFKSLAEGREECTRLEQAANPLAGVTSTPGANGVVVGGTSTPVDAQKYNTSDKRGPNQGIGAYSKERILAGKSNTEILAEIAQKFPLAKTTSSCIAYYRSALKKGPLKANPADLRAKAQELLKQAEAAENEAKAAEEAAKMSEDQAAAEATEALANPQPAPGNGEVQAQPQTAENQAVQQTAEQPTAEQQPQQQA